MTTNNDCMRDEIIDTAVALAARTSWEALRLHDVADKLAISLDDIRLYFREKDELVDAWFDRADSLMLREADSEGFLDMTPPDRVRHLIMTWLSALAVQRTVTQQMIMAKLEFGHIHIQFPAVMRISRTVQWVREAAHCDATFVRRALEETALTTIYLMTFFFWMRDTSRDSYYTRQFLERHLSMVSWEARVNHGDNVKKNTSPQRKQIPSQFD